MTNQEFEKLMPSDVTFTQGRTSSDGSVIWLGTKSKEPGVAYFVSDSYFCWRRGWDAVESFARWSDPPRGGDWVQFPTAFVLPQSPPWWFRLYEFFFPYPRAHELLALEFTS